MHGGRWAVVEIVAGVLLLRQGIGQDVGEGDVRAVEGLALEVRVAVEEVLELKHGTVAQWTARQRLQELRVAGINRLQRVSLVLCR